MTLCVVFSIEVTPRQKVCGGRGALSKAVGGLQSVQPPLHGAEPGFS